MIVTRSTLGPRGRNNAMLGLVRLRLPGETTKNLGLINPFEENPFDSWWWKNRKVLALGTAGVVGIGVLAIVGKVLR